MMKDKRTYSDILYINWKAKPEDRELAKSLNNINYTVNKFIEELSITALPEERFKTITGLWNIIVKLEHIVEALEEEQNFSSVSEIKDE